jgi:soluble lytic murein transglycosylase-like protein
MGYRWVCLIVLLGAPAAWADIYSYTDANGVVHYSNVPTDPRFSLMLTTPAESPPAAEAGAFLAAAARYDPIIEHAARASALHPALVRAVIVVESGYNPKAVSTRGAKGLMQLIPATAARYGAADIFDPAQNIRAGAQYLRDLLQRYHGSLELALAAYNAGEQAVDRYGGVPPFAETQRYVPNVIKVYRRLLSQAQRRAQV